MNRVKCGWSMCRFNTATQVKELGECSREQIIIQHVEDEETGNNYLTCVNYSAGPLLEAQTTMKIVNVNRRGIPSQFGPTVTVTAVLTEGVAGDHAAYIGIGNPEFVARQGNKLSYAEACEHFIGLKEENYRL